eukprot:3625941-Prymnesium_polylepis.1
MLAAAAMMCAVTSPWLYPDPPTTARKLAVRTISRSTVRTVSPGAPSSSFFPYPGRGASGRGP